MVDRVYARWREHRRISSSCRRLGRLRAASDLPLICVISGRVAGRTMGENQEFVQFVLSFLVPSGRFGPVESRWQQHLNGQTG